MRRVLFVDDEPNILSGLKRTMRVMKDEWDMQFIDDPRLVLEAFEAEPFDIVVSDMKMPNIDGADLLSEIQHRYPGTIRIILSGHADPAMVMKSVGSTHQYLAKPCEPEVLKATVQRAYALKEMIRNEPLQALVSELGDLPSIPSVYREIVQTVQDPDSSLMEVAGIIGKDLGMTTKILQLVNSAFFGMANPVTTIDRAVSFLGLDTIGSLVLGHGLFKEFQADELTGFDIEALWHRSAVCAEYAKQIAIAEGLDKKASEDAFLAGMLCDIGHLILAAKKPAEYRELTQRTSEAGSPGELELEMFGATHGSVGAYLVGLWGLPNTIVEAIAYHETPSLGSREFGLPGIVHAASRLAANPGASLEDSELDVDRSYLEATDMAGRWTEWQSAISCKAA